MAEPATGRPSRLLNLQKSPASKKAIAATNATTSPFLRLPPEIRQRIYNYALGGNVLHVASHISRRQEASPGPVIACSCPHDYKCSAHSFVRAPSQGYEFEQTYTQSPSRTFLFLVPHQQCFQNSSAQGLFAVKLNLLKTCRQIYHEAVLVPFKKNTFAITCTRPSAHTSTSVSKFLNSLVSAQLKAITNLIVQPVFMGVFTKNQLMRFKGLVALQYVLMVGECEKYDPQRFIHREESGFKKAMLKNLVEGLSQLRSTSFTLKIPSHEETMPERGMKSVPGPMKAWVASAEKRIMGS